MFDKKLFFNKFRNVADKLRFQDKDGMSDTLEDIFAWQLRFDLFTSKVQSQKNNFEITGDPKGPPSESTIWWGFKAPDSYGYMWAAPLYRAKIRKWQIRPKTGIC